jgi:integration host factor subunit beta
MTKAELIEEVSKKMEGLTRKQTELIVNMIFDSIKNALSIGDKIEIRGFGSFRLRSRNPRVGRNPKTGQTVPVPEKRVPFFKAGKELKVLVDR